jgi:DNA-binding MarR family transcriptional regulator
VTKQSSRRNGPGCHHDGTAKQSTAPPEIHLDLVQHVAELWTHLRQFTRATERAARKNQLTPQRYLLLLMIRGAAQDDEVMTVAQLTKQLQLAQSSVTELINRAEAIGIVTRSDSPADGRQTEIRLTEEGERRLQATISDLGVERRQFAALVAELKDTI